MTEVGITTLIIIFVNVLCSYPGLKDHSYLENYAFEIDKVLIHKDYKRLVTSGFFHVSGMQLILNMATLCFFSGGTELQLGFIRYGLIYFASLVGGNLFSLFIHRKDDDYSAVGATGAVNGIIFASIALFPGFNIGIFGIHLPIPGWFYGFGYVLFSIYGIHSKRDNIGHETHLAGGLTGLIIAVLMQPASLIHNYLAISALALSSIFFIYILITRPRFLFIHNTFFNQDKEHYTVDHIFSLKGVDHQKEIDLILEKIHQQGIGSLSKKEKEKLDYYSKMIQ
ncbi:MAG: rhomboid family intramembrane serine protease [Ferruginibacter sp.]